MDWLFQKHDHVLKKESFELGGFSIHSFIRLRDKVAFPIYTIATSKTNKTKEKEEKLLCE